MGKKSQELVVGGTQIAEYDPHILIVSLKRVPLKKIIVEDDNTVYVDKNEEHAKRLCNPTVPNEVLHLFRSLDSKKKVETLNLHGRNEQNDGLVVRVEECDTPKRSEYVEYCGWRWTRIDDFGYMRERYEKAEYALVAVEPYLAKLESLVGRIIRLSELGEAVSKEAITGTVRRDDYGLFHIPSTNLRLSFSEAKPKGSYRTTNVEVVTVIGRGGARMGRSLITYDTIVAQIKYELKQ